MRRTRSRLHCRAPVRNLRARISAPHVAGGVRQRGSMHAERWYGFRQGGALDRGCTVPQPSLHRPEPGTCSTRRTYSLLSVTILCNITITITVVITRRNTIAVTATVVIVHRKAHGPQSAPEALAVLLARALNVAVLHAQHVRASYV